MNISYRLLGSASSPQNWPAQLDDVQAAVRWIRENAADHNIDPERIGAFGHSSGAQLAAMLGVRETRDSGSTAVSSRVNCVVEIAGPMDMLIPVPVESILGLLGGPPDEVPEQYRDASPISWVDGNSSPFLLFQLNADDLSDVDQARLMSQALRLRGIEAVHGELAGLDRFQIIEQDVCGPWTTAFFARRLQPERWASSSPGAGCSTWPLIAERERPSPDLRFELAILADRPMRIISGKTILKVSNRSPTGTGAFDALARNRRIR